MRRLAAAATVCLLLINCLSASQAQGAPSRYPVWPSFLSDSCTTVSGGNTTIVCGVGGSLLSQVNSGYACNRLDISISAFSSGPFTVTATADSGTVNQTFSINETGDYTIDIPGYLVNNLIGIQIDAPDSGSMSIAYIQTLTCPVPNTATPVPDTATPNPSDTATPVPATSTAGPSHTPTTIPTNTPLPSGHTTFTATPTTTETPVPATATPSPTFPAGLTSRDCGINMVFRDCNLAYGTTYWQEIPGVSSPCSNRSIDFGSEPDNFDCNNDHYGSEQLFTAPANGSVFVHIECIAGSGWTIGFADTSNLVLEENDQGNGNCPNTEASGLTQAVTGGTSYYFFMERGASQWEGYIDSATFTYGTGVATITDTPTPQPGTATPTGTATPPPTNTPLPIPGAKETAIPTDTPCPRGCAVAKLTAVPGALETALPINTSPFTPLENLSLSRSACTAFFTAAIPMPHVIGTPVYGSTTPLDITWTLPTSGTTGISSTSPISATGAAAFQPCADPAIPMWVWDLTYWGSVLMTFIAFTMWIITVVARLSGNRDSV